MNVQSNWNVVGDLALRSVGLFYVFAGAIAARAVEQGSMIDRALASISGQKAPPAEQFKSAWLALGAISIAAAGVALMIKAEVALWLFIASSVQQALYLFVLAPLWFDRVDPPDEHGRTQTKTAFVIYLAATALVAKAEAEEMLLPLGEITLPIAILAAVAVAAFAGYVAWKLSQPIGRRPD